MEQSEGRENQEETKFQNKTRSKVVTVTLTFTSTFCVIVTTQCSFTVHHIFPDQCGCTVYSNLSAPCSSHMSHIFSLFFVIFQSNLVFFLLKYLKLSCCPHPEKETFSLFNLTFTEVFFVCKCRTDLRT